MDTQHMNIRNEYRVVWIAPTAPPAGAGGGHWFEYAIANDVVSITGRRAGTHAEVEQHARECVARLNERNLVHRWRVDPALRDPLPVRRTGN
ncbi:MAG: hypothetical protein P8076_10070 [Gammaproteobacteria bacterium]